LQKHSHAFLIDCDRVKRVKVKNNLPVWHSSNHGVRRGMNLWNNVGRSNIKFVLVNNNPDVRINHFNGTATEAPGTPIDDDKSIMSVKKPVGAPGSLENLENLSSWDKVAVGKMYNDSKERICSDPNFSGIFDFE